MDAGAAQNTYTSLRGGSLTPEVTNNSGNLSNLIYGHHGSMGGTTYLDGPIGLNSEMWWMGGNFTSAKFRLYATSNLVYGEMRVEADGVSGTSIVWATRESGNAYFDAMSLSGTGVLDLKRSTGRLRINGTQVVGPRGTALPVAAVDAATNLALTNAIRTLLITHGLTS